VTWLARWALGAGALGMLGVVAAHLLSRQRPRALALATARFLPAGMLEATTVQRIPMDRWWMLLRLLILALLAAGAAQPVLTVARVPVRTVLLLDRTLPAEVQRRALQTLAQSDVVIAYDTLAALVPHTAPPVVSKFASMSAALAKLVRVRDSLADGATQLRVAIASRFAPASIDPVTASIRALIPDSIGVVPMPLPPETLAPRGPAVVHAAGDDPIAATALLLGDSVVAARTIIERGAVLTHDDSVAATNGSTVLWWPARSVVNAPALQAVTVGAVTWLAPMQRDSVDRGANGRAVGWWADGSVAMRETRVGEGCILQMDAALPVAGDVTLSLSAQAWLAAVLTSCDAEPSTVNAPLWLATPPAQHAAVTSQRVLTSQSAPWLIAAALACAALELLLRRRVRA
jgi:hypothetical protein